MAEEAKLGGLQEQVSVVVREYAKAWHPVNVLDGHVTSTGTSRRPRPVGRQRTGRRYCVSLPPWLPV